jgi:arsenite methyltransferase
MSEKTAVPVITETKACCGDDCCGGSKNAETVTVATAVKTPTSLRGIPATSPAAPTMPVAAPAEELLGSDPRSTVREKYGAVAKGEVCGCGGACCGGSADDAAALAALGYTDEQRAAIPAGADLGLGCGNPLAHAALKPGETVLDLGSGGGIDCFLAAREVGPTGRVIGVDMTPAMIERARGNLVKVAATNVEFRLGEIEHLPVADGSVDAIISNCVVNLSPDKPQVFREARRVLKPGGRLVVSDLVLTRELGDELRRNVDLYVGCVAGASRKEEYLQLMRDAGFTDVSILEERTYTAGLENLPPGSPERDAFAAVVSVKVRAIKR